MNTAKITKENLLQLYLAADNQSFAFQEKVLKKKLYKYFVEKNIINKNEKEYNDFESTTKIYLEYCYYLVINKNANLDNFWTENKEKLQWLLSNNPFENSVTLSPTINQYNDLNSFFIEIGPRPSMTTPFSTNAISVLKASGITNVTRIEKSRCFSIHLFDIFTNLNKKNDTIFNNNTEMLEIFGDKMTECEYLINNTSCFLNINKTQIEDKIFNNEIDVIDVLDPINGMKNLQCANSKYSLGFDLSDFEFYFDYFQNILKRNPTDVELFDLAQSNSEHSRHWFFKGDLIIDNIQRKQSLFSTIQSTQTFSNSNNVIAFSDNSSAIRGFPTKKLTSLNPQSTGQLITKESLQHIVYTAETHNFPTGVCPFPGAATGVGGRIRDVHATGRGANEIAGVAGYCVGNLNLPNFLQPWEELNWTYPTSNFALPLKILLEASDGASDYGNKFGEPLISGFTRTFGAQIFYYDKNNKQNFIERIEYIKPIMFSGGIGSIDDKYLYKEKCAKGQIVAKIGGPVYRIGVGGGAASSCAIQGSKNSLLDFDAVQRGDSEMEHKLHRVIRACIECDNNKNPILSIHDQGAGGNGNVLKEIVDGPGGGAIIFANEFELGDSTISLRELWGAEYQESDAVLLAPEFVEKIKKIASRERCKVSLVGKVTGDERIVLQGYNNKNVDKIFPVNLNLKEINNRKQKSFDLKTKHQFVSNSTFKLPINISLKNVLERVLRLPSVASKRFLTSKVDRSVTGLIAQQQCVGPLHIPLADVAVVAISYWDKTGAALACGEQPIKGLCNTAAGARMSVGESLTNLIFAPITCLEDVKCSGNWMWAAKLPGEGVELVKACDAMCYLMNELGIAVDGGKDSLSMAANIYDNNGKLEIVKAPGTLVISSYAPCTNITKIVTPNFKPRINSTTLLLHLNMSSNCSYSNKKLRLGGSALAQCFKQVTVEDSADLDEPKYFKKCFYLIQNWIKNGWIISGHDVSDGGLLTTILESAFAGNCGVICNFEFSLSNADNNIETEIIKRLFSEELGIILEVEKNRFDRMLEMANEHGINGLKIIGETLPLFGDKAKAKINVNGFQYLNTSISELREIWEETSDQMELLQLPLECVKQQAEWRRNCQEFEVPNQNTYQNLNINITKDLLDKPRVAILREEGSNGDREMAAAFIMAGFEVYDVTMTDLFTSKIDILSTYCGLALVGGFSFADVFGSARGWAASILFNDQIFKSFQRFYKRSDTFSIGVCNGCQLMTLLNFIDNFNDFKNHCTDSLLNTKIYLNENLSGRFYSGFNNVKIENSKSIFFKEMENLILGVWCSHGQGRFTYKNLNVLKELKEQNLICLRYCNYNGQPTEIYPANPNGSIDAVAGLCSKDGRHLAMMPHPERSFLSWQCPISTNYQNDINSNDISFSPWFKMFQNAFNWITHLNS